MRHFLAALAVTALLCGSAFAVTITVDGDYSDWTALGLVRQDALGDNPGEDTTPGAVDINHYGATIIDGYLYAFTELTEPLVAYESGTRGFDGGPVMGIYIDADQSYATSLNGGESAGIDIVIEVSDALKTTIGLEYYGEGDIILNQIPDYDEGTAAIIAGEYVVEWCVPVSSIRSALGELPDGVDDRFDWTVYLGGEGIIKNADGSLSLDWGRDYTGPLTVPEPGAFSLLAVAGLALAMFGVRRLRRN